MPAVWLVWSVLHTVSRRVGRLAGAALSGFFALSVTAGCTGPGADDAAQVARSFEQLAISDAGQACDLLSGHTREAVEKAAKKTCPESLGDEDALRGDSSVRQVEVFGHDA